MADHAKAKRLAKEHMACNKPQRAPEGDTHKWVVKSCHDGEEKIVRYGRRGYEDYTMHHDEKRKQQYIIRHQKRENWNDPNLAGYWSRWLLWNKPTINPSYKDITNHLKNLGYI